MFRITFTMNLKIKSQKTGEEQSIFIQSAKELKVEITKQAVENAKENAKINGISNASFYDGDCKDVVLNLKNSGMKFDTVVVDPPRKGCSTEVINLIEEISPKKVVYVSCNSATLARDVKIFCEKDYKLKKLTPVDMFPQSCHVETIALLQNRNM